MTGRRDMLTVKLDAARKRHAAALQRVAAEERTIDELLAKKRDQYTRKLRRTAHWTKRDSGAERALAALQDRAVSR